jgi:DNA-binding NarL/FixJ family response regulator
MAKKSVLLIDDEKIILETISDDLRNEGYEVVTAPNAERGYSKFREKPYDLVITDLIMEGMNGIQLSKKLKKISPDTPVMVLTGYPSTDSVIEALRTGVNDYLLKPCDRKELSEKVRSCLQGNIRRRRSTLSAKALRGLRESGLTPREIEVCHLLREGCENREISSRLSICVNTTKNHIKSIYRKLNAKSRAELVARLNR